MFQGPVAQDAPPMTVANAQPRMASNTKALPAIPESPLATNAQPIDAMGAFRQELRLPNDWANQIPEWHRDRMRCSEGRSE